MANFIENMLDKVVRIDECIDNLMDAIGPEYRESDKFWIIQILKRLEGEMDEDKFANMLEHLLWDIMQRQMHGKWPYGA